VVRPRWQNEWCSTMLMVSDQSQTFLCRRDYPSISRAREYSRLFLSKSGVALRGLRLVSESVHDDFKTGHFYRYAVGKRILAPTITLPGPQTYLFVHNHWSRGYH